MLCACGREARSVQFVEALPRLFVHQRAASPIFWPFARMPFAAFSSRADKRKPISAGVAAGVRSALQGLSGSRGGGNGLKAMLVDQIHQDG